MREPFKLHEYCSIFQAAIYARGKAAEIDSKADVQGSDHNSILGNEIVDENAKSVRSLASEPAQDIRKYAQIDI